MGRDGTGRCREGIVGREGARRRGTRGLLGGRSPDSALTMAGLAPQALAGQQPPPSDLHSGLWLPAGAAGGHAGPLGGGILPAPRAGERALVGSKCCSRRVCGGLLARWADRAEAHPHGAHGLQGVLGLKTNLMTQGRARLGSAEIGDGLDPGEGGRALPLAGDRGSGRWLLGRGDWWCKGLEAAGESSRARPVGGCRRPLQTG